MNSALGWVQELSEENLESVQVWYGVCVTQNHTVLLQFCCKNDDKTYVQPPCEDTIPADMT